MQIEMYIVIGLVAGLLSGLIGIGGGVVIVPSLAVLLAAKHFPQAYLMQVVIATSLACITITTLVSTWSQNKRGAVNWRLLGILIPSLVVGVLLGMWLTKHSSTATLKTGFSVFAVFLGCWMLLRAGKVSLHAEPKQHAKHWLILLGILVGMSSGLLGIGGGVLLVPILLGFGYPMPQACANSVACAVPTAFTGAIAAMVMGWHQVDWPNLVGFVYLPAAIIIGLASAFSAPIGVYLCHRLPVSVIKRVFGGILLLIAWQMSPL